MANDHALLGKSFQEMTTEIFCLGKFLFILKST